MAFVLADRAVATGRFNVTDIDGLTGLAEYRNGGLFVDNRRANAARPPTTLRVRMMCRRRSLSNGVRSPSRCSIGWPRWCAPKLNMDAAALPLASILEGGTWAAGRAIAFARRPVGASPIKVVSDGTVF